MKHAQAELSEAGSARRSRAVRQEGMQKQECEVWEGQYVSYVAGQVTHSSAIRVTFRLISFG